MQIVPATNEMLKTQGAAKAPASPLSPFLEDEIVMPRQAAMGIKVPPPAGTCPAH